MEFILNQLNILGFDTNLFLKSAILLAIGSVLLGAIGRFVFGKRSTLHCSVSSVTGILLIYAVTIVIYAAGANLQTWITPLPFVEISNAQLSVFVFESADFMEICTQVLRMVILAFLVNLIDGLLPRGKNFFVWLLLRIVTVAGAMVLHVLAIYLLGFLPLDVMQYAPMVLLALLVVLLLVGSLKIVVGAVLTTVNPIIGILYTFFFANIVGKALTKAILTTAILSGLVYLLNRTGIVLLSIAQASLVAYIPLVLILLLVWFVIGRLFEK